MSLREAGHTDAEASRVGMDGLFIEAPDEGHEIGSVLKGVFAPVVILYLLGRITAEGEDVTHARLGVEAQDFVNFLLTMADTGEMWCRVKVGGRLNFDNQIVCHLAGGATRSVGDADVAWLIGLEFRDGLVESLRSLSAFWGKKFERENALGSAEDVTDMHGSNWCGNGSPNLDFGLYHVAGEL